ncbi:MAG TPA: WD40 repeat domain-containing serine/threonine protein kinase [Trebonia sp.]
MTPPIRPLDPLQPGDPTQVGAYRLLSRLGAGGMGQVYLGVSRGGRKVAVKVLRADLVTDEEFRTRFAREVAAARTVNGFYTAPVVDADPNASPPWMVTAYVAGPSLAAAVADRGPFGQAEVRELGAALTEGLAVIHACGLVHRDLKPANIILADDGPRIIDFGIARAVGTSTMTAKGTIIGTYTFMSPEQIMGLPIGPESDVFSLGSVIAYAATGHGPFDADTIPTITYKILAQPPDLTGIAEPLRELITDCLHKEPAKRPDLDSILTRLSAPGESAAAVSAAANIPARPASTPSEWAVPPVAPEYQAVMPSGPSAVPFAPATPVPRPAGPSSFPSVPPLPSVLFAGDGRPLSHVAFSPASPVIAASAFDGSHWRIYVWDIATGQLAARPVDGLGMSAPRLAFSPDGKFLTVRDSAAVCLCSMATGQMVTLSADRTQESSWNRARFSPNGRLLATFTKVTRISGFTESRARVWAGGTLQPAGGPFKIEWLPDNASVVFSPDDRFLLAGTDQDVLLCDTTSPTPLFLKVRNLDGTAGKVSFSFDGRLLAAQRVSQGDVCVLDIATRQPISQLASDRGLTRVQFSPAARILATVAAKAGSGSLDVWHLAAGQPPGRVRLGAFDTLVADMRFSPDGTFIAAVTQPGKQSDKRVAARLWHVHSAQPGTPLELRGPAKIAFSPDSRFLAASCADQGVRLLDLRDQKPILVLPGASATFAPSGRLLATTEPAGVRLWTLPA